MRKFKIGIILRSFTILTLGFILVNSAFADEPVTTLPPLVPKPMNPTANSKPANLNIPPMTNSPTDNNSGTNRGGLLPDPITGNPPNRGGIGSSPGIGTPGVNTGFPAWNPGGGVVAPLPGVGGIGGVGTPGIGTVVGGGMINLRWSCPLVDTGKYGDIIATLDSIKAAIPSLPDSCRTDSPGFAKTLEQTESVKKSAEILKKIWEDPDHFKEQSAQIEPNLAVITNYIKSISSQLSSNPIINSNCGGQLISTPGFLDSLSNLILGIAPMVLSSNISSSAISGATIDPTIMIGTIGIASLIDILDKSRKQKILDMQNDIHRTTLLKAICGYTGLMSRIQVFQWAKTKDDKRIDLEIRRLGQKMSILSKDDDELTQILLEREKFYSEITVYQKANEDDRFRVNEELLRYNNNVPAGDSICTYAQAYLNSDNKSFPLSINSHLQDFKTFINSELISSGAYTVLTDRLKYALIPNGFFPAQNWNRCKDGIVEFLNGLNSMLYQANDLILERIKKFEIKLANNKKYAEWYKKVRPIRDEKEIIQEIRAVISTNGTDPTGVVDSETDQRVERLERTLFGDQLALSLFGLSMPEGYVRFSQKIWKPISTFEQFGSFFEDESPVESWLNHTLNLYERTLNDMDRTSKDFIVKIDSFIEERRKFESEKNSQNLFSKENKEKEKYNSWFLNLELTPKFIDFFTTWGKYFSPLFANENPKLKIEAQKKVDEQSSRRTKFRNDSTFSSFPMLLSDLLGGPYEKSKVKETKKHIDSQEREKLDKIGRALNPKKLSSEDYNRYSSDLCKHMNQISKYWTTSLDYLSAMKYFCSQISPYFNKRTSKRILDLCGDLSDTDIPDPNSKVSEAENLLTEKGYVDMAAIVSKGLMDFQCR